MLLLAAYGVHPNEVKYLTEPVFSYAAQIDGNQTHYGWYRANSIFTAMALADPERAIGWLHDFYPRITGENLRLVPQPWMAIAKAIGSDEDQLWEHIQHEVFHLWVVDREDL